jgi:hypothetical protein
METKAEKQDKMEPRVDLDLVSFMPSSLFVVATVAHTTHSLSLPNNFTGGDGGEGGRGGFGKLCLPYFLVVAVA